jgi:hypothetical protein
MGLERGYLNDLFRNKVTHHDKVRRRTIHGKKKPFPKTEERGYYVKWDITQVNRIANQLSQEIPTFYGT